MCYFDQTRWNCGFWRWTHFRQQCTKEYRTGETCGLKLVYVTYQEPDICKLCKDIEKKQRKYAKLESDVARWRREGNRTATIEKAMDTLTEISIAINGMVEQHNERMRTTN